MSKTALTAANIKYLLTLHELDTDGNGIRCVDVAGRLGVRKPSVHTMMSKLGKLGLTTNEKYGAVRLTDAGSLLASQYAKAFCVLLGKLEGIPGLPTEDCRNAVFRLLAQTSEEGVAELIRQYLPPPQAAARA